MTRELRMLAAAVAGVVVIGMLLVPRPSDARKDAVAAARRYALRQRAGEAELGIPVSLGVPVSTGERDRWSCVVFATVGPAKARVGVLLTAGPSGWEGWFVRTS